MKISMPTEKGLALISDYIYAKKGVRVNVLPPTNGRQIILYCHALECAENYFKDQI